MIDAVENPGSERYSPAKRIGAAIASYMMRHPNFYLFSPDETTSNKLDAAYEVSSRAWELPQESWDLPESANGRIVEMLSENTLFACMAGHLMNGEPAMMTSYEAFFTIIAAQVMQHIKFLQQSERVSWRQAIPAANLLSTSTCWRQDHNGFTHQSPALVSLLLSNPSNKANCLFPIDDVAAEAAFIYMAKSQNVVNLTTFNKTDQPRWIDSHQADAEYYDGGASILNFISDDNPDYVFAGVGDIVSGEAIEAIKLLKTDLPDKNFRFVNIVALSYGAIGTTDRKLKQAEFDKLFTRNKPIIANFHGYPDTLRSIFSHYVDRNRVRVHGFLEQGSTTTPFEMLSLNETSRYHLALDVARLEKRDDLVEKYQKILADNHAYALKNGIDKIAP